MIKVSRIEKHIVKESNKYFKIFDEYCFLSKNLYNYANYHLRQTFIICSRLSEGKKISQEQQKYLDDINLKVDKFNELKRINYEKAKEKAIKNKKEFNKKLYQMNYFSKEHKYLSKQGRNITIFTNQNCKIKNGYIKFPKYFDGFLIKTKVSDLQQVRVLPRNKHLIIEVVYKTDIEESKQDNDKYIGIDIGLDNLATIGSNTKHKPIIISGRKLKSINKYYNKQISYYREIAKRMNNVDYTNKMNTLTIKRNNMINDLIHKASKSVIGYALSYGVNTIIIGNNKDWKRESKMSKKVNQSFVGIPHQMFIKQVLYKAENIGINVIITEESYTSGTSFLDKELPIKKNYNKSRRIKRGLFKSNTNKLINADLNAAYQIIKKVFPKAFDVDGIEDVGLHPIRVGI